MADTDTQEQGPWTKYQTPPPSNTEEGPWTKYAQPAASPARQAPTRTPGESRPLSTAEVNAFQPPTQFEKEQQGPNRGFFAGLRSSLPEDSISHTLMSAIPGFNAAEMGAAAASAVKNAPENIHAGAASAREATPDISGHPTLSAINKGISGVTGGTAGAIAPLLGINPVSQRERALKGDTAGILGESAVPTALALTPLVKELPGKVGTKVAEMRQPARISNFMDVLRELTGKKPADLEFTRRAQTVLPDIAKVARESSFDEKGNARVGEFKEKLDQRARDIWQEEHKPQIAAQEHLPIDHEAVAQRARAAISTEARANNPAGARAADRWIESALNADSIGTIGKADNMMRHINAEIPNLPEPFKNIGKTVRNAAGEAIRGQLEQELQEAGEEGVSNPNSRWGALKEISTLLDAHLNNAANAPLNTWDVLGRAARRGYYGARDVGAVGAGLGYLAGAPGEGVAIGAPIGAAAGVGASLAEDILRQPGGRIARAMRGLGKTNLQPDTVQLGIPRLPYRAGPDTSGPTSGGIGPYSRWNPAGPAPPNVSGEIGGTAFDENRIGATGREGTRFAPKGLLPAPTPEGPVGVLPTLSGPVTNQMWGIPEVQAKPGFEIPGTEMLGPWGTGTPPTEPPPTIAPMKPPLDFPPRPGVQEPLDFTKPVTENAPRETVKPMEKPGLKGGINAKGVEESTKARTPEQTITSLSNEIDTMKGKLRDAPDAPAEEREALQKQIDDYQERLDDMRKAEKDKGILPGMSEHVEKQAEGAAKVKGEDLTREANTPKNIEEAAGEMERKSPVSRGTPASPQGELLKPMEKPKAQEQEEGTDFKFGANAEEEPEETHIKGITAKEKTTKAKAVPVEKRFEPEEIERAELLIRQDLGALQSMDKPARVPIIKSREGNQNANWQQIEGYQGIKSGREMLPFFQENPKFAPGQVEKALRNKDSAMYQRMIERAVNLDRRMRLSPEERADVEAKRPSASQQKPGLSAADFLQKMKEMKKPAAD